MTNIKKCPRCGFANDNENIIYCDSCGINIGKYYLECEESKGNDTKGRLQKGTFDNNFFRGKYRNIKR